MKVLDENEKFLRLIGLFPPDQSTMVAKIRRVATICVFSALPLITIFGSVFYIYFHLDDISDCIIALLEFFSGLATFVAYTEILANTPTVERISDELQFIVNNGKY